MNEQLRLRPWYETVRGEIVRPERGAIVAEYFWMRWASRLGPEAIAVLLWMRARLNAHDGVVAEFTMPPQDEIVRTLALTGIKSLRAALRRLEATGFLERRAAYRWDDERKQTVHLPDKYMVAVVDPIAPEDEGRAIVLAAERAASDLFPTSGECVGPEGAHTRVSALGAHTPCKDSGQCVGPEGAHTPQVVAAGSVSALRAHSNVRSNVLRNVNVAARQQDGSRRASLVAELVETLGDPRSRGFYQLVAAQLPEDRIRGLLSETRDARHRGLIRTTAPAYFTDLAKRLALELGVSLARRRTR